MEKFDVFKTNIISEASRANMLINNIKRQAGAEVSRFEVFSLEGFFFRSPQLIYKIVYTCIDVISSEEDTTENTKHLSRQETLFGFRYLLTP